MSNLNDKYNQLDETRRRADAQIRSTAVGEFLPIDIAVEWPGGEHEVLLMDWKPGTEPKETKMVFQLVPFEVPDGGTMNWWKRIK